MEKQWCVYGDCGIIDFGKVVDEGKDWVKILGSF